MRYPVSAYASAESPSGVCRKRSMLRPAAKPKIAPVSGPSRYATATVATSPRSATTPETRRYGRIVVWIEDDRDQQQREADEPDHPACPRRPLEHADHRRAPDVRERLHEDRLLDRAGCLPHRHDAPDRDVRRDSDCSPAVNTSSPGFTLKPRLDEVEPQQVASGAAVRDAGAAAVLEPHRDAGLRVGEQQHGRAPPGRLRRRDRRDRRR